MAGELRFGRYILERRLAAGGMAEVFLARLDGPVGFEKRVVIKRMLPALAGKAEMTRLFLDEARLAALFQHPNLIQVYELFEVVGQYAMAMEYLEGVDLEDIAARSDTTGKSLPAGFTVRLIADAAAGLRHAHELRHGDEPLNIVHRDISPSNIFVTWDGVVKVVDFGIAKSTQAADLTREGWFRGKVAYMAPEQTVSGPLDARADIFSLGVVFYELLAGQRCYPVRSEDPAIVELIRSGTRPPIDQVRSDLPDGVIALVEGMLDVNRDTRIGSAAEVRRQALGLLADLQSDEGEIPATLADLFGDKDQSEAWRHATTAIGVRRRGPVAEDPVEEVIIAEEELATASAQAQAYDPSWADTVIRTGPTLERTRFARYGAAPAEAPLDETLDPAVDEPAAIPLDETLDDVTGGRETLILPDTTFTGELAAPTGSRPRRRAIATILALVALVGLAAVLAPRLAARLGGESVVPTPMQEVPPPAPTPLTDEDPHPVNVETIVEATPESEGESEAAPNPAEGEEKVPGDRSVKWASLSLSSEPTTDVWLNGQRIGRTPIRRKRIAAGSVRLSFKIKSLGLSRDLTLRASPGESLSRHVVFGKGKLVVNSQPWAEVYVGGRRVGTTPLPPTELYEGTHRVRLRNPDLPRERTITIQIKPGETTKVREALD